MAWACLASVKAFCEGLHHVGANPKKPKLGLVRSSGGLHTYQEAEGRKDSRYRHFCLLFTRTLSALSRVRQVKPCSLQGKVQWASGLSGGRHQRTFKMKPALPVGGREDSGPSAQVGGCQNSWSCVLLPFGLPSSASGPGWLSPVACCRLRGLPFLVVLKGCWGLLRACEALLLFSSSCLWLANRFSQGSAASPHPDQLLGCC